MKDHKRIVKQLDLDPDGVVERLESGRLSLEDFQQEAREWFDLPKGQEPPSDMDQEAVHVLETITERDSFGDMAVANALFARKVVENPPEWGYYEEVTIPRLRRMALMAGILSSMGTKCEMDQKTAKKGRAVPLKEAMKVAADAFGLGNMVAFNLLGALLYTLHVNKQLRTTLDDVLAHADSTE